MSRSVLPAFWNLLNCLLASRRLASATFTPFKLAASLGAPPINAEDALRAFRFLLKPALALLCASLAFRRSSVADSTGRAAAAAAAAAFSDAFLAAFSAAFAASAIAFLFLATACTEPVSPTPLAAFLVALLAFFVAADTFALALAALAAVLETFLFDAASVLPVFAAFPAVTTETDLAAFSALNALTTFLARLNCSFSALLLFFVADCAFGTGDMRLDLSFATSAALAALSALKALAAFLARLSCACSALLPLLFADCAFGTGDMRLDLSFAALLARASCFLDSVSATLFFLNTVLPSRLAADNAAFAAFLRF